MDKRCYDCYWNQQNKCALENQLKPLKMSCHYILDKVGIIMFTPQKTPFKQNIMFGLYHDLENKIFETIKKWEIIKNET